MRATGLGSFDVIIDGPNLQTSYVSYQSKEVTLRNATLAVDRALRREVGGG